MTRKFSWLQEPSHWEGGPAKLTLRTDRDTDFWQKTFYGFAHDNGHAYLADVEGDFSISASVIGSYEVLYDQAGLMLRIDGERWIKTGIEQTDGLMHFSVVVTNGSSDWSVIPLSDARPSDEIRMQLTRHGDAVRVQYAVGNGAWKMARLAPFSSAAAQAGIMACSPQRGGFVARFRDIAIGPPIARKLHDD